MMLSTAQWTQAVKDRDGWACVECGSEEDLIAHHITPIALGGKNTLDNGKTVCRDCHIEEHSGEMSTVEMGKQRKGVSRQFAAFAMGVSMTHIRDLQATGRLPVELTEEACIGYMEEKVAKARAEAAEIRRRYEMIKAAKGIA